MRLLGAVLKHCGRDCARLASSAELFYEVKDSLFHEGTHVLTV
ncbi:hypothetical protein [Granulicella aggregans]|nr:hypothetical protein [Granulicella aggregans]